jgi:hypothetical protein
LPHKCDFEIIFDIAFDKFLYSLTEIKKYYFVFQQIEEKFAKKVFYEKKSIEEKLRKAEKKKDEDDQKKYQKKMGKLGPSVVLSARGLCQQLLNYEGKEHNVNYRRTANFLSLFKTMCKQIFLLT